MIVTAREALAAADAADGPAPPLYGIKGAQARTLAPGENGASQISGYNHSLVRVDPEKPFPVVMHMGGQNLVHPSGLRGLSAGEYKAAMSFPSKFSFRCGWTRMTRLVGNCVPPLLAAAVGARANREAGMKLEILGATYKERLDNAWSMAKAPRQHDAPTVVSTFAGCGGSSLGYAIAGYREVLAVEWDKVACETFRANFPEVPVFEGDIAKLTVERALEMTGLKPGELDVLDGSPPCQGFSSAGKRVMDDPRNSLFREYVRLLRGLKPKAFVMENVAGMVKGKMKLVFVDILKELKASGYRVRAKVLNAMWYGVPQSRERMIFIGIREDLNREPVHPDPS